MHTFLCGGDTKIKKKSAIFYIRWFYHCLINRHFLLIAKNLQRIIGTLNYFSNIKNTSLGALLFFKLANGVSLMLEVDHYFFVMNRCLF